MEDRPRTLPIKPIGSGCESAGALQHSKSLSKLTRALSRAKSRIKVSGKIQIPETTTQGPETSPHSKKGFHIETFEREEKTFVSDSLPPQKEKKAKKRSRMWAMVKLPPRQLFRGKKSSAETLDQILGKRGLSMYWEPANGSRDEEMGNEIFRSPTGAGESCGDKKPELGNRTNSKRLLQRIPSPAYCRSVSHNTLSFYDGKKTLSALFGGSSTSREGESGSHELHVGNESHGGSGPRVDVNVGGVNSRDGRPLTNLELAMAQPNEDTIEELFRVTSDCTGSDAEGGMSMQAILNSLIAIENNM